MKLPDGVEMVMPGDNARLTVELLSNAVVEKGMRFAIREGGKTVGAGVVTNLLSKLAPGEVVQQTKSDVDKATKKGAEATVKK